MNISDLEVPPPQQVQRVSTEASDKDAEFLSLRLLNKRTRVRLSPEPLDLEPVPGKAQLFAVANSKGWFVAAIRNSGSNISLIFSLLTDLRAAFHDATPENAENVFKPQRTLSLAPAIPNMICFAALDSRMVVGLTQGPVLVYDTTRLFSPGSDEVTPLHSFPSTTSSAPRQILPNPGDIPELVAILRDNNGNTSGQLVEILDIQKLESVGGWRGGSTPDATPTALSWSPKGKQIAIGLQSGDIVTFNPMETNRLKFVFERPPCANGLSVIGITWLSNPTLHTIYAPVGPLKPDVEQTHIIMSLDAKKNTASDIRLVTPYFPSPAIRPPGSFIVVLRNWEPTKILLFAGDSSSSDIGVIGAIGEDSWHVFSLEETSTPSLPLDKDMNDTVLVSLDMDLTFDETYHHTGPSGEASQLPPPPIMYAYASDGTVLGWLVVNSQGESYPGMALVTTSMQNIVAPSMSSAVSQNDMQMASAPITPIVAPAGPFGQPQPVVGPSLFSPPQPLTSPFGQPASISSGFGQTPSGFGQPSAFGQATTTSFFNQGPSAFGTNNPTGGFGAFASSGPAKFGPSTFGAASSSPTLLSNSNSTPSNGPAEDSMASDEPSSFEGLSLGGSSESKLVNVFGSGSIFGQATQLGGTPASGTGAFGQLKAATSSVKPAEGFGAFGTSINKDSPFFNPKKEVGKNPTSVFAPPSTPDFPPKSGSTIPVFGSPSVLGGSKTPFSPSTPDNNIKSSLGPTTPVPGPRDGGFAAFSGSSGFSSFAGTKTLSFGDMLRGGEKMKDPSKPVSVFSSSSSDKKPAEALYEEEAPKPSSSVAPEKPFTPPFASKSLATPQKAGQDGPGKTISGIKTQQGEDASQSLNSSLASLSTTSRNSSFVQVTAPQEDEESSSPQEATERPEELGSDVDDDTQSFLSESFSDDENPDDEVSDDDDDDDDENDDENEERSDSQFPRSLSPLAAETVSNTIPSTTPQPKSRSPSTTPRPTLSSLNLSSSPSPPSPLSSLAGDSKLPANTTEAGSTSPPGSPPQDSSKSPLSKAPVPVPAAASTSPFGLGFGRPSTRPTRSSPLANAPLSPDEVERQTKTVASVPESQSSASQPKRPKTPPLLFVGAKPAGSTASSRLSLLPSSSALSIPSQGRLDVKAPPDGDNTVTPSSLFDAKLNNVPSTTPFRQGLANSLAPSTPSSLGQKPTNPPALGSIIPSASTAKAIAGPSTTFGSPFHNQDNRSTPFIDSQVPKIPLSDSQERGMQAECQKLCEYINAELAMLEQAAQRTRAKSIELSKPSGLSHHRTALSDSSHWTLGDASTWGQVLRTLQDDIEKLRVNKKALPQSLRELEASMLRAGTKKEEIARFDKARNDPEFAKMLQVRTLGPEHLETQNQLRRDIRVIRDRVQTLEDNLEAFKKRLNQMRAGKPSLRAPTLDKINRTYRNIDIVIDHQAQQISQLTTQLRKLNTSSARVSPSSPARDSRLPDLRRPRSESPAVAFSVANALNGEIAASRLKRALISVRQEPLLNNKAAIAPAAHVAFDTPQKLVAKAEPWSSGQDLTLPSLPSPSAPPQPPPTWNTFPSSGESPFNDLGPQRRRRTPAPKFKRAPTSSPSASGTTQASTSSFDWGPLPTVASPNSKGLPFGFAKSPSPSPSK